MNMSPVGIANTKILLLCPEISRSIAAHIIFLIIMSNIFWNLIIMSNFFLTI